jgi:aryl-alcohol dehydrogenase-like predicted oxidoreductase
MIRSLEGSLKRLNTDYVDLLYLHMWDYTTPLEEVMRGMDDLVRAGKVRYIGFSDTPAYIIARANALAECRGLSRVIAVQLPYSLFRRDPERELLPMAREEDLAVTAWGMLGAGVLTGKFRDPGATTRYESAGEAWLNAGDRVKTIAGEIGHTPAQVAINWVRQGQDKAQIIPILGARTLKQMEENLGVLDFELSPEEAEVIDAISDFTLGFPRSFLHDDEVLELLHGETYPLLDNHRK